MKLHLRNSQKGVGKKTREKKKHTWGEGQTYTMMQNLNHVLFNVKILCTVGSKKSNVKKKHHSQHLVMISSR